MGYDFEPRNKAAGDFRLNAFSWPVLLGVCNYVFPVIHKEGQWCQAPNDDPRFQGDYPGILCNDGFRVTAEEAKIMARLVKNFVAIQRSLPEASRSGPTPIAELESRITGRELRENPLWPSPVSRDLVDAFERWAEWAEKSGGFAIY